MRRSMVGLLAAVGTALSTLGALALGSGVLVIFAVVAAAAAGLAAYLSLSPVAASTPAEPLPEDRDSIWHGSGTKPRSEAMKPGAPGRIRTHDPLLRRHPGKSRGRSSDVAL